jgi:hypothetical protein
LLKNARIDFRPELLASTIIMFFSKQPTLALGGPSAGSSVAIVAIASTYLSFERVGAIGTKSLYSVNPIGIAG